MDNFKNYPTTPTSPARSAVIVTPNDAGTLTQISRAVYVGVSGDLAVTMADGSQVTFEAVPAGSLLPIRVQTVRATGTTAGALLALS